MKTIKIEIKDNPQRKDLNKILKEVREKFLDWGIIVTVELQNDE